MMWLAGNRPGRMRLCRLDGKSFPAGMEEETPGAAVHQRCDCVLQLLGKVSEARPVPTVPQQNVRR